MVAGIKILFSKLQGLSMDLPIQVIIQLLVVIVVLYAIHAIML